MAFAKAKAGSKAQPKTPIEYLLLYVDDIVLIASSLALLRRIISALQQEFSMKDFGEPHHFLGMHV